MGLMNMRTRQRVVSPVSGRCRVAFSSEVSGVHYGPDARSLRRLDEESVLAWAALLEPRRRSSKRVGDGRGRRARGTAARTRATGGQAPKNLSCEKVKIFTPRYLENYWGTF